MTETRHGVDASFSLARVPRGPKSERVFDLLCRIGLRWVILIQPFVWILTKRVPR